MKNEFMAVKTGSASIGHFYVIYHAEYSSDDLVIPVMVSTVFVHCEALYA